MWIDEEWMTADAAQAHRGLARDLAKRGVRVPSERTVRHLIYTGSLGVGPTVGSSDWAVPGYGNQPVTCVSSVTAAYLALQEATAATKAARAATARAGRTAKRTERQSAITDQSCPSPTPVLGETIVGDPVPAASPTASFELKL